MSSDSTELTFVRCPSCRSLVPAISTRCRMCGAALDASAASESSGDSKRGSRVRQKTMTGVGADEKDEFGGTRVIRRASDISGSNMSGDVPVERLVGHGERNDPSGAEDPDPLGDYLSNVGKPQSYETPLQSPRSGKVLGGHSAPPVEEDAERFDAHSEPQRFDAATSEARTPSGAIKTSRDPRDIARQIQEALERDAMDLQEGARPEAPATAPRVILESGSRKPGKPSGLSFSKPKEETKPEAPVQQAKKPNESNSEETGKRNGHHFEPAKAVTNGVSSSNAQFEQENDEEQAPEKEAPPAKPVQRDTKPAPTSAKLVPAKAVAPQGNVKAIPSQSGRLFGWLVSYADSEGTAVELHEGKFFVTRSSLKETDLIIDDESISTPHALVVCDSGSGLSVQDLMSSRGVFVRRQGADTYQREEHIVHLEHGDWLRVGDVEFLVALIAHVGKTQPE